MEYRIEVGGHGGQGIVVMSHLLANMGMTKGLHVTWFPSYGAEMRGGSAYCSVVLSNEPVASPLIQDATHLIVMNSPSLLKLKRKLVKQGTILFNSSLIFDDPCKMGQEANCVALPASEIARELGLEKVANMVMLGGFLELTSLMSFEEAESSLREKTPSRHADLLSLNLQAVKAGQETVGHALSLSCADSEPK